jgi:hypothetical protein
MNIFDNNYNKTMMNGILSDLDDFLAPSQECIKMIVPEPKTNTGNMKIQNDFEEEIKVDMP